MAKIDVDALAEEVTSAANIVTNGGYYEIDIDAVAQCLMRALAPAEAETAELRKEVGRLREALAAEDAFRIAYRNWHDAPRSNRADECIAYVAAAQRCDNARTALATFDAANKEPAQ